MVMHASGMSRRLSFFQRYPMHNAVFTNADGIHKAILYSNAWTSPHRWERPTTSELKRERQGISSGELHAMFLGASEFNMRGDVFYETIKNEIGRCFPGVDEKVTNSALTDRLNDPGLQVWGGAG